MNKPGGPGELCESRRILLIANSGWYLQNFRESLVKRLEERGFVVTLAAPAGEDTQTALFSERNYEPVNFSRHGRNPFGELLALASFLRLFRRVQPQLVFTWTPKPNIYGGIAGRLLSVPVIPNVSGLGTVFIRGGWLASLVGGLYGFAFACAPVVFFQNEEDRVAFVAAGRVESDRTERLPGSGVDMDYFQAQPLRDTEPFVFLYLGRLLRDKGLRELVEATQQLRNSNRRFVLRLAGSPDSGNPNAISPSELESWVASGTVEYLGSLSDARPALAAAHCVVLPSYREGVPRSLLEAAATARPLITTDVPGCRDTVLADKTGFLCEPRSVDSLVACMARMLDMEPRALTEMGRAGRAYVERFFPEEQILEAYLRRCEPLCAGALKVHEPS